MLTGAIKSYIYNVNFPVKLTRILPVGAVSALGENILVLLCKLVAPAHKHIQAYLEFKQFDFPVESHRPDLSAVYIAVPAFKSIIILIEPQ